MSRPKGPRRAHLSSMVKPELLERFRAAADDRGISRADYLEEILEWILPIDENTLELEREAKLKGGS